MKTHEQKVREVAKQILSAKGATQPVRVLKKSVPHFVPNPYKDMHDGPRIDISELDEILEIDPVNRTCTAEPGVTFEILAKATLAHNLIPATVSELKGITIGGAVSGCSIESMSYRYGGFHDTCLEYEILTGTGEIATCTPEQDSELFHMIHGSYGTLGILTKLKFQLLPAKPYVQLEYRLHDNFDEYWADMKERCEQGDYEFIDGIVHSPNKLVMVLGNMIDQAPTVSKYDWLDIFYKNTLSRREDFMTTYDYFFRYDAECHWLTATIPPLQYKPVRFAVGKVFLGSDNLISWSNRLRHILKFKKRPEVVVDVFIPSRKFKEFYEWYVDEFEFWPLWIVPYKMKEIYPWVSPQMAKRIGETFMIDCAVYGKLNNRPDVDYSEMLEKKVLELGGIKTLISRNHYDQETFWDIYNKELVSNLKARIDPGNLFGDLYEKFAPNHYVK